MVDLLFYPTGDIRAMDSRFPLVPEHLYFRYQDKYFGLSPGASTTSGCLGKDAFFGKDVFLTRGSMWPITRHDQLNKTSQALTPSWLPYTTWLGRMFLLTEGAGQAALPSRSIF